MSSLICIEDETLGIVWVNPHWIEAVRLHDGQTLIYIRRESYFQNMFTTLQSPEEIANLISGARG